MINQRIKENLLKARDQHLLAFNSFEEKDTLLLDIFKAFQSFDIEAYQEKVATEIRANLTEWWINPEKGIVKEETLFAILFEFDATHWSDREAVAYGIHQWEDFEVFEEDFDMGYNYDFATEFYAAPGITLDFFNCFSLLDQDDKHLDPAYRGAQYFDLDGFEELVDYIKTSGYLAIQAVFAKLQDENFFENINRHASFLFLLGEHDVDTYPMILIEQ